MATLFTKTERGRPVRMLQILVPGRGRKTLRLGRLPQRAAERFRDKVEELAACRRLNQAPDSGVVAWLRGLADDAYRSLAEAGLVEPRDPLASVPALAAFLDKHLAERARAVAPRTLVLLRQTEARLNAHFGARTPLTRITPDGAADWRESLLAEGLAEATVRLHTRHAKSVFNAAVDRELIPRNPFRKLPSSAVAAERDHYVPAADAERVLAALPGDDHRALFALARYAGLRVPSETHGLTWDDVDLEAGRLAVYAPKTGRTRTVPIVPRLAEVLRALPGGPGPLLALTTNNLHRTVLEAIARAGLPRWPDLFQTLRRSCETDFAARFPAHVAAAWLGHSVAVSARHYLQVPASLLAEAAGLPPGSALHQALQHRAAPGRTKASGATRPAAPPLAGVA